MWESVISALQWAFPSGLSLVNIFLLRELWKRNKSRISKDTIDTWHQIANSNNEALERMQSELAASNEEKLQVKLLLAETNGNLKRLERMLDLISACKYFNGCPVRPELSEYQKVSGIKRNLQPVGGRKSKGKPDGGDTGERSDAGDTDSDIEAVATGCSV